VLDNHEYRKLLSTLYPSKFINKKVKATERVKKVFKKFQEEDEEEEWETDEEEEDEEEKIQKKKKNQKNNKKRLVVSEESDSDSEYIPSSEDDEQNTKKKGSQNVNIILTIAGEDDDDDYCSDCDDDDEDTEDEHAELSSDDDDEDEDDDTELKKNKTDESSSKKEKLDEKIQKAGESLEKLKGIFETDKSDKFIQNCIKDFEEKIKKMIEKKNKKQQKYKDRNLRIFTKILKDKNVNDDFSFYEKMDVGKQMKIIEELREINKNTRIEKPYRMSLLESEIPVKFKCAAMKKINALSYMEPGNGDYYKLKTWVDTFMKIPFNTYSSFPITIEDGVDKCHEFMANAQKVLDTAVYGLNDAKMQVMQLLGQLLTNPKSVGTAIGIHGPPGTGKTSLIKEGISKILNRPFSFVSCGGAQDGSVLKGHPITYEGSVWGKIVQALIDSKSMDVVFLFDEIDKTSDSAKGQEIIGILTHLIDTTQNTGFHDEYFGEIEFDLSRCLFIFSYNDESRVNPILLDRMYRIQTKGYITKEKLVIATDYLLPKIREQVKFKEGEIIIPEETLTYIIDNHCQKEDGVRNMKRCLEIIHTKMNLYRLMRPGSNLFGDQMTLKVEFPFTITKDVADKLIKKTELSGHSSFNSMYL
jgi:ATP-dependent Lon protease